MAAPSELIRGGITCSELIKEAKFGTPLVDSDRAKIQGRGEYKIHQGDQVASAV